VNNDKERSEMGLSDKLKQFGDKAKDAAAEHRDQISNAVETAAGVADKGTKGRYTDKIHRATQKTEGYVDRLGPQETEPDAQPEAEPDAQPDAEPDAQPEAAGTPSTETPPAGTPPAGTP
jgi:hypothetical protein